MALGEQDAVAQRDVQHVSRDLRVLHREPLDHVTRPDQRLAALGDLGGPDVVHVYRQHAAEAEHVARPENSQHHFPTDAGDPAEPHAPFPQDEQAIGWLARPAEHLGRLDGSPVRRGEDRPARVRLDAGEQAIRDVARV